MANKGIAGQLNHIKILKMCEGIINKYFSMKNKVVPTPIQLSKIDYAVKLYSKSIPQTTNLDGNFNLTGRMVLIPHPDEIKK